MKNQLLLALTSVLAITGIISYSNSGLEGLSLEQGHPNYFQPSEFDLEFQLYTFKTESTITVTPSKKGQAVSIPTTTNFQSEAKILFTPIRSQSARVLYVTYNSLKIDNKGVETLSQDSTNFQKVYTYFYKVVIDLQTRKITSISNVQKANNDLLIQHYTEQLVNNFYPNIDTYTEKKTESDNFGEFIPILNKQNEVNSTKLSKSYTQAEYTKLFTPEIKNPDTKFAQDIILTSENPVAQKISSNQNFIIQFSEQPSSIEIAIHTNNIKLSHEQKDDNDMENIFHTNSFDELPLTSSTHPSYIFKKQEKPEEKTGIYKIANLKSMNILGQNVSFQYQYNNNTLSLFNQVNQANSEPILSSQLSVQSISMGGNYKSIPKYENQELSYDIFEINFPILGFINMNFKPTINLKNHHFMTGQYSRYGSSETYSNQTLNVQVEARAQVSISEIPAGGLYLKGDVFDTKLSLKKINSRSYSEFSLQGDFDDTLLYFGNLDNESKCKGSFDGVFYEVGCLLEEDKLDAKEQYISGKYSRKLW